MGVVIGTLSVAEAIWLAFTCCAALYMALNVGNAVREQHAWRRGPRRNRALGGELLAQVLTDTLLLVAALLFALPGLVAASLPEPPLAPGLTPTLEIARLGAFLLGQVCLAAVALVRAANRRWQARWLAHRDDDPSQPSPAAET